MVNFPRNRLRRVLLTVGLGLQLCASAHSQAPTLTATKIDGTQVTGALSAWTAQALTLSAAEDTSIQSSELLRVEWPHNSSDAATENLLIELVDGTRMTYSAYEVQGTEATVTTTLAKMPLSIAKKQIAKLQLTVDADLQQISAQGATGDVLMVRKKSGGVDFLTGVIGNVSPQQVEFTWEGDTIPVKRSKLAALSYFRAKNPPTKKSVCWLNLRDGSRLPVAEISAASNRVQVTTPLGLELAFPTELLRDADYSQGKLVYLSDLQPVEQQWTPLIGLPASAKAIQGYGMPRRDQSFAGSALALLWRTRQGKPGEVDLKTYSKGLALRSRTEIRYRIPDGMKRLIALAGIDPETAGQGNVVLEIFADRESIWREEIDGNTSPHEIDVTLGSARELRIVVDYGTNLDFGDRLHLAEARLSR